MADDAGALLVRSGLVPSSALDDARVGVTSHGGTVGEHLVLAGVIADQALTDFYRSRLLVPLVNPNTLARLPVRVVAAIPSDMAIELRAIPVSLDADNNLTVAMSDPSDSHAVDEIGFFTGSYVVRAVATQMQIAWCLAHYYGHVTLLGHRLLQPSGEIHVPAATSEPAPRAPRTKGLTGQVQAMRHKAIAPTMRPHDLHAPRPTSSELDLDGFDALDDVDDLDEDSITAVGGVDEPELASPATASPASPPAATAPEPASKSAPEPATKPAPEPAPAPVSEPAAAHASDGAADRPRARSVSGEIRVPIRRAPSIRPPIPEVEEVEGDDDESGPTITVEVSTEPLAGPRRLAPRRRVKTDPPELAARAGEVSIRTSPIRPVEVDEPRIIIADDEPPPADVAGELKVVAHRNDAAAPATTIEVDDTSVGVVIHEHYSHDSKSEPIELVPRKRPSDAPTNVRITAAPPAPSPPDPDPSEVVVLESRKPRYQRAGKRTQVGIGALPALTRTHRDTETTGAPTELADDAPTGARRAVGVDLDPTRIDARAVPPALDDNTDETLAAPPAAARVDDRTNPRFAVSPPRKPAPSAPPTTRARPWPSNADDEDGTPLTAVMSATELDDAIPERTSEVVPGHLQGRTMVGSGPIEYDSIDDGWGPPGTTIPPPLLGAMPGSDDSDSIQIPMLNVDSAPLVIAPPAAPQTRPSGRIEGVPVRALEEATSRSIELIHLLERAKSRDEVIKLMSAHLAESHRVSGFFSIKGGDLGLFSMKPRPEVMSVTTLRLDRPSTLQDVVGTRLPYRGPMHDDASRNFLASVLGACPAEILLVPIAVRERVVGVLFGEQRLRHTFDDQLALASRAAGMALERILKTMRG